MGSATRSLRGLAGKGMFRVPVAGDVHTAGEPHLLMAFDVFDEALECGEPGRAANQTAVQTDGEHLRRVLAFGIQHVERVLQVLEKLLAVVETLHLCEAHVVGVQRIRDHQMRLAGRVVRLPVRQVIVVGVAIIKKAAFLHDQPPCVGPGAAGVPAQWAFAADFGQNLNGLTHVLALLGFVHVLVVDPAITVAADFVTVGDHCANNVRVTLRRHGDSEDGQGNVELFEQLENAPHAGSTAVLVQRLHAHVALALQWLGRDHFGQKRFGFLVAMQNIALATFLVIQHERQGNARIARPAWMRRVAAVTDQVAWVVSAHCKLPYVRDIRCNA
ncbi:hypothetical protein ALQ49_05903 [Pseudomonas syringae pv. apii]|uniref:Uncharacterized protein n=1 Tax=Pseudomonas syringae pv. apii TaxID=81036 RepID=A0A3M3R327_9PSED|nr:hypothetical protein ALQ49_05903 [Pseudomonas syringae pv. apii]